MKKNTTLSIFLTIIIPVYNEKEVLKIFHGRRSSALEFIHKPVEILYVDDGSQVAQEGYDIVYARPLNRQIESWLKKNLTYVFYKTINSVANIHIPGHASDFHLLSRRAIEAIKKIKEQHRFMKGLFAWVGYPQKSIDYKMDMRFVGKTKWSYLKLWNFAIEGITSFTIIYFRYYWRILR